MEQRAVALVTGASSGFGRGIATELAARGFRVFGTSRNPRADAPAGVEMLVLDVTDDTSARECVERVHAASGRLDVLVNNAGQTHISVIEETTAARARAIMEADFWGVVRMTEAVLPIMRRQRRGRIINVSSLAGLVGAVGQGFYSASKFALEGYSEVLSAEVASFGVSVSLIEPGFFRTNLDHGATGGAQSIPDYDRARAGIERSLARAFERGGDPRRVAALIGRVATAPKPRLRYRVGNEARWTPWLRMLLPEPLFRLGVRRRFDLPS